MTTDLHTLVLIILCGVVTLLIRVIPFVMISRVNLPAIVIKWLSFIPITLFTALIIDGVIQQHDHAFGYTLNLPYIIAIVPTVMLAIFTRSLTVTILGGIFVIACLLTFNLLIFGNHINSLNLQKKLVKIKIIRKFRLLGRNAFLHHNTIKLPNLILRSRGIWPVEASATDFK